MRARGRPRTAGRRLLLPPLLMLALLATAGCEMILPDVSHQPVVFNPFPQLSRVAVAPFFNLSDEPTLNGREVALAYFAELQATAGFEVVPLGVVEEAILAHQIDLSDAEEARRLAKLLGVDALVVGAVTDFSPYYPPRCGLRVEWYTANPGYHEIPPGYGLPWGTPEEEYIPRSLAYEAEMALARAQLETQTPLCELEYAAPTQTPAAGGGEPAAMPEPAAMRMPEPAGEQLQESMEPLPPPSQAPSADMPATDASVLVEGGPHAGRTARQVSASGPGSAPAADTAGTTGSTVSSASIAMQGILPPDLPDARGFVPSQLRAEHPECLPHAGPVMTHTRIYHGDDPHFAEALSNYVYFRADERFGGQQTYLQQSDEFIRFCCHMHISEMLSARGGAGETRVLWRWPASR